MQDVIDTLEKHTETFSSESELGDFARLSQRWATHSLATYTGELLTRALAISKALAEFDNELLGRNDDASTSVQG